MVDYQARAAYLLSLEGGNISALARSTGVSRRTLRRMLQGSDRTGGQPYTARSFDPAVRRRFNRAFRRDATPRARREDQRKRGEDKDQTVILPEPMTKAEAQRVLRVYQRLGVNVWVSGEVSVAYKDDDGEIPLDLVETQYTTLFTQGMRQPDVETAETNLAQVLTEFINADHVFHGNSPIRVILDPLPLAGYEPDEGMSYAQAFRYRVYQPLKGEGA